MTVETAATSIDTFSASSRPGTWNGSFQCLSVHPCHTKLKRLWVLLNENQMMITIGNSRYASAIAAYTGSDQWSTARPARRIGETPGGRAVRVAAAGAG